MDRECWDSKLESLPVGASVQDQVDLMIGEIIDLLPDAKNLSDDERRGIISRYTAVLEGNFIYWMTGAYLSIQSEEGRPILLNNIHEEVRDCHPGMLRRFALAANAYPTDSDALAIHPELMKVREFVGRLSGVRMLLMMAFFEGFIQKFMSFLEELATYRGSVEREYTEVHGVCDVAHTRELFRALSAEMALHQHEPVAEDYEGVYLLRSLLQRIVQGAPEQARNHANGIDVQSQRMWHRSGIETGDHRCDQGGSFRRKSGDGIIMRSRPTFPRDPFRPVPFHLIVKGITPR